ncbi:MAG: TIM barrel protein [Candidatus Sumerlaeia bacterium]|nr:TIM barrel protein [Candidatus Sumerlaeia bacterium]
MKPYRVSRREFAGGMLAATAGLKAIFEMSQETTASAAEAAAGKPRLSVCIEALFTKVPFVQRLDEVKKVGLNAFEFWGWRNKAKELDALAKKKDELGLTVAAFSCDAGGALVAPGSKDKFLPALKESLEVANKLGAKRMIITVGQEIKDMPREAQHNNIVEALKAGAPLCEQAGVTLCLEPLNVLVNHKGYFLATSDEGFQIIDEVASPNVRLLFDIYHQQITEGNIIRNATSPEKVKKIGHYHVADVPGRAEPGTGEIHWFNVFKAIAQTGYNGFIGLEMWPKGDHAEAVKATMKIFEDALAAAAAEPALAAGAKKAGGTKEGRKTGKKKAA